MIATLLHSPWTIPMIVLNVYGIILLVSWSLALLTLVFVLLRSLVRS